MSQDCSSKKAEFTFIWQIENYSESFNIYSPEFVAETLGKTKWLLSLSKFCQHVLGKNEACLGSVTIKCLDGTPNEIKLGTSISCLSPDGKFLIEKQSDSNVFCRGSRQYFHLDGFKPNEEAIFLSNDTLTLRCHMWQNYSKSPQTGHCYARSRLGMTRILKVWNVNMSVDFYIKETQTLSLHSGSTGGPSLELVGFVAKSSGYFHIEIHTTKSHRANCKISVLKDDGKPGKLSDRSICYFDCKYVNHYRNFILKSEIESKTLSLLIDFVIFTGKNFSAIVYPNLDDNCLGICKAVTGGNSPTWCRCFCDQGTQTCQVQIDKDQISKSDPTSKVVKSSEKQVSSLQEDMLSLYAEKKFCDLILRAGDQTFPVHKAVLCSRSQRFRDIFTNYQTKSEARLAVDEQMEFAADSEDSKIQHVKGSELGTDVIDITDVDSFTLNLLLNFMYSDNLDDVQTENSVKLYFASVKYGVLPLKEKCLSLLKSSHALNLSASNVCDVLVLSDGLEGDEIRKMAEDFFCGHAKDILVTDAWKFIMESKLQLATQLMYKYCLQITEN